MNGIAEFYRSLIGKKVVMAVSGILLVGFLLSHMASNVLVFKDPESLTHYGEWLRSFGPLLWVARLGLLGLAVAHIVSAIQLTRINQQARPVGYQRLRAESSTWGARSMRIGGVILLLFIVLHILHFTTGTIFPGGGFLPGEVGANVVAGFTGQPAVVAFYVVAMVALGLHLSHGVWSFFQTLGLNHPHWNRARRVVAAVLTIAIAGGLLIIPIGVAAGLAGR